MQSASMSTDVELPLPEPVGDVLGEAVERDAEPFGGERAQRSVEVGADAVEVDPEDERGVVRPTVRPGGGGAIRPERAHLVHARHIGARSS